MPAFKMTVLTSAMACLGVFAHGALSMAPYSENAHTETAAAQEIGSTTSDGFLVYSVNFCTIVHTTACEVSLSTGGAVPSPEPTTRAGEQTTSGPYATISDGVPTETGASDHWTPEPTGEPTAVTSDESPVTGTATETGSEVTGGETSATATDEGETTPSGTGTGATSSSTGSAAMLDSFPGVVVGAAGMAVAYLI